MYGACMFACVMYVCGGSERSLSSRTQDGIPPQGRPFGTGGALSLLRRVGVEHPWNPWDTYSTYSFLDSRIKPL